MKKILLNTLLCVSVFIIGCTTAEQVNEIMNSWIGIHYSEVISEWGPPQQIIDDGRGGKIITWSHQSSILFPGTATTNINPFTGIATTTQAPGMIHNINKYRTFYTAKDGIICKWSWRGL